MSKTTVTKLFIGGGLGVIAGAILAIATVWIAIANDVFIMNGPDIVGLTGGAVAWSLLGLGSNSAADGDRPSRCVMSPDPIGGRGAMASDRWTAADLPVMSGQTAVVTGASSGIGAVTARELARAGARVVLAVRDVAKGRRVARTMAGDTEVRELKLDDLASVRAFASAWTGDLDILINNAGIMLVPEGRTQDGFELHIGTNHLGHFALTNLLLPHITRRVVTVSSHL